MTAIKRLFGWLGRKAILYVLLVAALIAHQFLLPSWRSHGEFRREVRLLQAGTPSIDSFTRGLVDEANKAVVAAQNESVAALDKRIAEATTTQREAESRCRSDLVAAFKGGAQGVLDNQKACFTARMQQRQITALTQLRDTADARRPGESLRQAVRRHTMTMRSAAASYRRLAAKENRLRSKPLGRFRHAEELKGIDKSKAAATAVASAARARADHLIEARKIVAGADKTLRQDAKDLWAKYSAFVEKRSSELSGTVIERARGFAARVGLGAKLRAAAIALAVIIASPFLIRLFCYFVLAPLAMRRAAIRVRVPGGGAAIPLAERSATSVPVRLAAGDELLVRQGFLQTTSHAGTKQTQWALSWRHPLTSLATGLVLLTRIRGDGEVTTVSAVRDPFAEVTILTLPEGTACVLQPRALAAVVQPIGRRLRVTSHWRLGSLNAWLTLQLRYIVFHGPARLVVKGGRGVRVERAERGRVFGQEQLVGFSADLAYSVTRTETFWPYLFGQESLLKDRVEAGEGVLIIEEAPFSGRGAGGSRRGLEGLVDAGMKVFGM